MKIFALLLSLFFAVLITVPCNDANSDFGNELKFEQKHNQDGQHNDICSVFCTCHCCGTVLNVVHFKIPIPEKRGVIHIAEIPDFQNLSLLNIPFGIWQPPKIA